MIHNKSMTNTTFEQQNIDSTLYNVVANQDQAIQKTFLIKTYSHILLAVCIFAATIFTVVSNRILLLAVLSIFRIPLATLVIMAVVVGASVSASWVAHNTKNTLFHYIALLGYAFIEGLLTVPIVYLFLARGGAGVTALTNASWLTVLIFALLTAVVFVTKPSLGFLGKFLAFFGVSSFVLIILSAIFSFALGTWFTVLMIFLACGYILYETSEMTKIYNSSQYVASALTLFSSLVMLFWYILRLFSRK